MELVTWSEKYSVNNNLIDSQHKKLVGLINQLHTAMKEARGKEILQKILDELLHYTENHFGMEERMMAAAGYPGLQEQKMAHQFLVKKVIDLQKQFNQGKVTITLEIMNFLQSWLINHIQGMDKKYEGKI